MATPAIRIRVGASLDTASVDRAFAGAEKRAGRAEKAMNRNRRSSMTEQEREHRRSVRAQEQLDRQRASGLFRQYQQEQREFARKEREKIREHQRATRQIERQDARQRKSNERVASTFARRTSHRATRFLTPNAPLASIARRQLSEVVRGAGVDTGFGGAISRNVDLERVLTDAVNSAAFAGQDVDVEKLNQTVRGVAAQLGLQSSDVAQGALTFQKKTGDLGMAQRLTDPLAKLALATGTKFDDMASAAGDVANALGDVPNKAELVISTLETIAGQGARGAVEVSDLANGMARLTTTATRFEGETANNIKTMGALAQLARATGGAASPREALTAIARFTDQLSTPARAAAFRKAGVEVKSQTEVGKFADPIMIIKRALVATKGDPEEMARLFASTIGRKPVTAITSAFFEGGGAKDPTAGLAAVDKALVGFLEGSSLDQGKLAEALKRATTTDAARAQKIQEAWDETVLGIQRKLLPALEEAAPALIKFGETVGNLTTWLVENPRTAIAGAITLAIGRAGIESVLRSGIERMILGANSSGGAMQGKTLAALGALGTITALSVTTLTVGMALIDSFFADQQKEDKEIRDADFAATQKTNEAKKLIEQGDTEGARKKLEVVVEERRENVNRALSAMDIGWFERLTRGLAILSGEGETVKDQDRAETARLEAQFAEFQAMKAALQTLNNQMAEGLVIREMPDTPGGNMPAGVEQ